MTRRTHIRHSCALTTEILFYFTDIINPIDHVGLPTIVKSVKMLFKGTVECPKAGYFALGS